MGGPVDEPQQQVMLDQVEETARSWFDLVKDWLTDLSAQEIPGSVVILIVLVALAPGIFKLGSIWISRHRR